MIQLYRKRYKGFSPTLASEKLLERDGLPVSDETLRKWLLESGDWKKVRRKGVHRQWREREGHLGEMVQMDGSHHNWFEGRGSECVLMGCTDDATGEAFGRFYAYEGDDAGRALRNDFTVAYNKKLYQIEDPIRAAQVQGHGRPDGSIVILSKDRSLKYREILTRPVKEKKQPVRIGPKKTTIPPKDHYWRNSKFGKGRYDPGISIGSKLRKPDIF